MDTFWLVLGAAPCGCSASQINTARTPTDGSMPSRESRIGATCAIVGSVLLFIGTYLHPMGADPNDAVAAFTEYAADRLWVASHLTQLAGVALMVVALLFLTQQLEATRGTARGRIAA